MNSEFIYLFKISDKTVGEIKEMNIDNILTPNNLKIEYISTHSSEDPNYPFSGQKILKGTVDLNKLSLGNIEFEIRTGSKFLFIYTGHSVVREETIKTLKRMFEFQKFIPESESEYKFLSDFRENVDDITFLKNGALVPTSDEYDEDTGELEEEGVYLDDDYFDKKLGDEYSIYHADICLSDVNDCDFDYYGNAIQIRGPSLKYGDYIINTFERYMA